MSKALTIAALLTACLAASSCTTPGDFCAVVKGPLTFAPDTARAIVQTDRNTAERIETQNVYGAKACKW